MPKVKVIKDFTLEASKGHETIFSSAGIGCRHPVQSRRRGEGRNKRIGGGDRAERSKGGQERSRCMRRREERMKGKNSIEKKGR